MPAPSATETLAPSVVVQAPPLSALPQPSCTVRSKASEAWTAAGASGPGSTVSVTGSVEIVLPPASLTTSR